MLSTLCTKKTGVLLVAECGSAGSKFFTSSSSTRLQDRSGDPSQVPATEDQADKFSHQSSHKRQLLYDIYFKLVILVVHAPTRRGVLRSIRNLFAIF